MNRGNRFPSFGAEFENFGGKEISLKSEIRRSDSANPNSFVNSNFGAQIKNCVGSGLLLKNPIGLEAEEFIGLNLENSKRRMGGEDTYETMDTEGKLQVVVSNKLDNNALGVSLSEMDCVTPSSSVLTQLARQASRSQ